ncbi:MAG: hypothetical protein Unbinned657contig1001_3 [Prokaryotic dsDNA virus sp.]|nr:MAG: hypothetical protein Unbinned657contig1001_3 [Prokaryotic dsDNA virus sp.]|tara:strand:+ start:1188 stop:1493 length:306 start_codon:yes stop_codon:yes gene_type:complete
MINNNNTNFFSIRKEVIEIFRQQNPTGYFHLLYLIQDDNCQLKDTEIKSLRKDIEKLNQQHIGEINEARAKLREQIKSSTKKYVKMLERNKKEIQELKNKE